MWSILFGSALAAEIIVDAQVPTELAIHGLPVAQVYIPSRISVEQPEGVVGVTLFVDGEPQFFRVEIKNDKPTWFVVGRNGVSVTQGHLVAPEGPSTAELRVTGKGGVRFTLGKELYQLGPGEHRSLSLEPGEYPVDLRDAKGTAIWARGTLKVEPGATLVVQLADGRLPEITGAGAFIANTP